MVVRARKKSFLSMCGIAASGVLRVPNGSSIEAQAEAMASAISRRGPDASGVW